MSDHRKSNNLTIYKYSSIGLISKYGPFYSAGIIAVVVFYTFNKSKGVMENPLIGLTILMVFAFIAAFIHILIHPVFAIGKDGLYVKQLRKFYRLNWENIKLKKRSSKIKKSIAPSRNSNVSYLFVKSHGLLRKFFIVMPFIIHYDELVKIIESHCCPK